MENKEIKIDELKEAMVNNQIKTKKRNTFMEDLFDRVDRTTDDNLEVLERYIQKVKAFRQDRRDMLD